MFLEDRETLVRGLVLYCCDWITASRLFPIDMVGVNLSGLLLFSSALILDIGGL